jgi:hypothetical protein
VASSKRSSSTFSTTRNLLYRQIFLELRVSASSRRRRKSRGQSGPRRRPARVAVCWGVPIQIPKPFWRRRGVSTLGRSLRPQHVFCALFLRLHKFWFCGVPCSYTGHWKTINGVLSWSKSGKYYSPLWKLQGMCSRVCTNPPFFYFSITDCNKSGCYRVVQVLQSWQVHCIHNNKGAPVDHRGQQL